jgi:murein DD-endopeptidase MepM/ murein hydrolase activator NlpD
MQTTVSKDTPKRFDDKVSASQGYPQDQRTTFLGLARPFGANAIRNMIGTARQSLIKVAGDDGQASRSLAHMTMIFVAILAIGVGSLELSWGTISAVHPLKYTTATTETISAEEEFTSLTLPTQLTDSRSDILVRAAVPRTIIPDRTTAEQETIEIKTYYVEPGDTISSIAAKFGLSPETLIWANQDLEKNPDFLWVGQALTVLPVDGVYHQVGGGDTLDGIAGTFKVDPAAIIDYPLNEIDPDSLLIRTGQWLIVPGGNRPFVPRTVAAFSGPAPADASGGTGIFGWPASGSITQGYFGYHPGLDIGGWQGASVLAADSGYVIVAQWDGSGYGNMIVIDHGNGFQTVYAHLQSMYVGLGTNVSKGQQIGEMGSTGNATGPHLHFELRQGTVQRNPYGFLP